MGEFTLDDLSVGIKIFTDDRPKSIDNGLDFLLHILFKADSGPVRLWKWPVIKAFDQAVVDMLTEKNNEWQLIGW